MDLVICLPVPGYPLPTRTINYPQENAPKQPLSPLPTVVFTNGTCGDAGGQFYRYLRLHHHTHPLCLSDICGYGRILRESTASDPIAVTGFGQTTCYDVHYAGYVNYSIPEENCPALREAIGDSCCVDYYKSVYCKVCDYGNVSTIDEEVIGFWMHLSFS